MLCGRGGLTWLLVQDLLEFGSLVLHSLLQEVRPQALDGEVDHVRLHQAQDSEDPPAGTEGEKGSGEAAFTLFIKHV